MNAHTKIAGIPAWGWGIALVGGLLLGIYLRRRGSAPSTVVASGPLTGTVPAGLADIANGATGGGLSPAPPSMEPALLDALLASQSGLIASEQTLGALTDSSVHGALDLAGLVTDRSFTFASDAAARAAVAPVIVIPSSPSSGASPAPPAAAPVPSAPPPQQGITSTSVPGLSSGGAETLLRSFGG